MGLLCDKWKQNNVDGASVVHLQQLKNHVRHVTYELILLHFQTLHIKAVYLCDNHQHLVIDVCHSRGVLLFLFAYLTQQHRENWHGWEVNNLLGFYHVFEAHFDVVL